MIDLRGEDRRKADKIGKIFMDCAAYGASKRIAELEAEVARLKDRLTAAERNLKHERQELERARDCLLGERNVIEHLREQLEAQSVEISGESDEPVAEIIRDYQIVWRGKGGIAPIVEKHGLTIGSKLYARPSPNKADVPSDDSKRLDWMASKSAFIGWGSDGEKCAVYSRGDEDNELNRLNQHQSFRRPRDAIDHAISLSQLNDEPEIKAQPKFCLGGCGTALEPGSGSFCSDVDCIPW